MSPELELIKDRSELEAAVEQWDAFRKSGSDDLHELHKRAAALLSAVEATVAQEAKTSLTVGQSCVDGWRDDFRSATRYLLDEIEGEIEFENNPDTLAATEGDYRREAAEQRP